MSPRSHPTPDSPKDQSGENSDETHPGFDWSLLRGEFSEWRLRVARDWEDLLRSDRPEEVYHQDLASNAGFFFGIRDCALTISKLRLGGDLTTDLVLVRDRHSLGLSYELVELEVPHKAAYTKANNPSARLTRAIQQVQDWREWLSQRPEEAKRLFPGQGGNLSYSIFIGRRDTAGPHQRKLIRFGEQLGIQIRSFHRLSDLLAENDFRPLITLNSSEERALPLAIRNRLADPFRCALTDKSWRSIVDDTHARREIGSHHFIARFADAILGQSTYNESRAEFVEAYERVKPADIFQDPERLNLFL